ncbi:MAG: PorT family protein [Flavobacteriaceae bacterium]|nr:PorT family protein [Bacteroidia bacterium]NNF74194.1 PorT family protein [Flavobacteriaceae bacterium]NNK72230.1 PorT family protein [Flavobacteriaceae bacterium]
MILRSLISSLLLLLSLTCAAQEYTFGARGGINTFTIGDINSRGGSISAGQPDELFTPDKDIGYQLGVFLNVEIGKLYFQPEFNYMSSQNTYNFPDSPSKWTTSKFELPILIGYKVFDPVSIYVGPVVNFFGDTKLEGVQVTSFSDGGPDHAKNTFNVNFGVRVKWNRFAADLRYEMGLSETTEELLDIINSTYGVNLADLKAYTPNVLSLSLSVDIFSSDDEDINGFFSGLFKGNGKCYCPY